MDCLNCNLIFKSDTDYYDHLKLHKFNKKALFKCSHCAIILNSYPRLLNHRYRMHKKSRKDNSEINPYCCKACNEIFSSKKSLYSHCVQHLKNNYHIQCPFVGDCGKANYFKNLNTFRVHYLRRHKLFSMTVQSPQKFQYSDNASRTNSFEDPAEQCAVPESVSDIHNIQHEPSIITDQFLNLFVSQQIQSNISSNAFSTLIDYFFTAYNTDQKQKIEYLQNELLKFGLSQSDVNEVCHNFSSHNALVSDLFDSQTGILRSAYMRNKTISSHEVYVKPREIVLGENDSNTSRFSYVPILDLLTGLFKNPDFTRDFFSAKKSHDGFYCDINDGEFYKENIFWNNRHNIQLIFYQDSFEICNPLGNAKGKHKIVGMYLMIGNLSKENKSQVRNIYLIGLCKEKDFKNFGSNTILSYIVDDVKILEQHGINVVYEDVNYNLKGSIFSVIGDNLGSHQVGGFLENFSKSEHFCRVCYITRSAFKMNPTDIYPLRNIRSHESDLEEREKTGAVHHNGVKYNSVFNELEHYHVTFCGMPPCIAHDLFEGIIPMDLRLIFKYLVKKRFTTFDKLIYSINKYFKQLDLNANIVLRRNFSRIFGRAYDFWCLARILTLLCADFDNRSEIANDPACRMLLLMKNIVDVLVAPKISELQRLLLKDYISEYLECRLTTFDEPLKPKHHYLQHYPYFVKKLGPLTNFWTLRCESKHSFFKNVIRSCRNFKNVTKLCAEKHQYQQSIILTEKNIFNKMIITKSRIANVNCLSDQEKELLNKSKIQISNVFFSNECQVEGVSIKSGQFMFLNRDDFGTAYVIKITRLVIMNNCTDFFVIGEKFETYEDTVNNLIYLLDKQDLIIKSHKDLMDLQDIKDIVCQKNFKFPLLFTHYAFPNY